MSDTHAVISAFLDDEAFEPVALAEALSDPAGRALLIDLLALRRIVQPEESSASVALLSPPRRFSVRSLLAAAAMLITLAGGYLIGERHGAGDTTDPPAPSQVVHETVWQTLPPGGGR
jgi:hypothetical protein